MGPEQEAERSHLHPQAGNREMLDGGVRDIKQNGKCYAQRQAQDCRGDLVSSIFKKEKSLGQAVSTMPCKGKGGGKKEGAEKQKKSQTGREAVRISIRGCHEAEGRKRPCVSHWESAKPETQVRSQAGPSL